MSPYELDADDLEELGIEPSGFDPRPETPEERLERELRKIEAMY